MNRGEQMVYTIITSGMMVMTLLVLDGKAMIKNEAWTSKLAYGLLLLLFLILLVL